MLDSFRTEVDTHVDTMAERVVQLGPLWARPKPWQTKPRSSPYPVDIYKITDHLTALAERYGTVANAVRAGIDTTDEAGDADTADILTGFSRALDKSLWFLEAHLQEGG
jgi:starvation-inducible DNA-binding protein